MKKSIIRKTFFALIILIAIVNCIFQIIYIANEFDIYKISGTFAPSSIFLKYSFEIILNLLFVVFLGFLSVFFFYNKFNKNKKMQIIFIVFSLIVISCLFAYYISNLVFQEQSLELNIKAFETLLEGESTPLFEYYNSMIIAYQKVRTSLIPLFYTNSITLSSLIIGISIWIYTGLKDKTYLSLPVNEE